MHFIAFKHGEQGAQHNANIQPERHMANIPDIEHEFFLRAERVAAMDLEGAARDAGPVFFDRGLIDAAAALQRLCGVPLAQSLGESRPYGRLVFLAPPWPDIYCADEADACKGN